MQNCAAERGWPIFFPVPSFLSLCPPSHSIPVVQKLYISGVHKDTSSVFILPESLSRSAGAILNTAPPQHTRYLQVGSPARVEMEVELRRVKFLDVFICFLSSHLLMSPSPKREPSSEPKHAGPGKTRRRVANFRDHVCTPPSPSQGSAGKPPGPCSQCLKHPRGAECPGGDEERGGLKWGERSLPGQRSRQGPISPLPYFYWIGVTRKPRWRRQLLPHWEKHGCD